MENVENSLLINNENVETIPLLRYLLCLELLLLLGLEFISFPLLLYCI